MTFETTMQLVIVAFGCVWTIFTVRQFRDELSTGYKQLMLAAILGLMEAFIAVVLTTCAAFFALALIGLVT